ncbi:NACHT domain-containing protein [Rhizobium sp. YJ-22]|uniref:NACHT domain-containing protein n=1 Tax=Rhizobium sp. YJ-22 TaxID=3037556 RepID=UPI002412AFEF|nr:NACHT domain-containing protein [Rhizobium sp. YJ-22]MDG3580716.1 NACHT domain-containing protein [Rhizobium sp. YJ-22]
MTTADRVELQQLKYSAANASASWTVSRISAAKTAKPESSVIGKMARAYAALVAKRIAHDPITVAVQLVTNQRIDDALIKAIDEAKAIGVSGQSKRPKISSDLQTLTKASGLALSDFCQFARSFDLVGATGSRFLIENDVLKRISQWEDVEFVEIASELRRYVHDLMLPERAGEFVTPHDILLKLGAGDPSVLFPAPSYIDFVDQPVKRTSISDAAKALGGDGHQYFCLHGNGGLGKTTALQLIAAELPEQSVMVVYDCYGAGSYLDASKSRHRQRDAFVQLANEVAERLKLPTYLVPRDHTDFPRALRRRIDEAAKLLSSLNDKALLVVTADAIDNASTAARSKHPPEPSFAQDLMSLEDLPTNVRILVSCRTSRLSELPIPARFQRIELEPFALPETAEYVRKFWNADDDWIDEFHKLSKGVPRVQSYALKSAPGDYAQAIDALRPDGKALDQIFQTQLVEAFRKHGDERVIRRFCAAVTHLPRPVPIDVLSSVLNVSRSALIDIVADLVPGFTQDDKKIGFADEDFEAYARVAGADQLSEITRAAADHFLATASTSAYAALAVVPMMFSAGQYENLLNFVEREPEPPTGLLPDVAQRREIGTQRLRTAIRVCRTAGNNSRALRFIMMGAEAVHSDDNLRQFLIAHRSLSVRFAEDSVRRLVLRDPDYVASHGPILLQMIGHRTGPDNRSSAHELRKRVNAWFKLRWDTYEEDRIENEHARAWSIEAEDFAQTLYAELSTSGVAAAVGRYRGLRHWRFAMDAGLAVVDRLLAEGQFEIVNEIADSLPLHRAVFVLVPLAMSGAVVDPARLEDGLRALFTLAKPSTKLLERYGPNQELGPRIVDIIISGVELLVMRGRHPTELKSWLSPFLDNETRRIDRLYGSHHVLLDAIMRSYLLCEALEGRVGKDVDPLAPRPKPEGKPESGRGYQDTSQHDRELREVVGSVSRAYAWRAQFIASGGTIGAADGLARDALRHLSENAWSINRHYESSGMRAKAAESIAVLAGEPRLAREVVQFALTIRNRWSSYEARNAETLLARLRNVKALHGDLVSSIANEAHSVRRDKIGAADKSSILARFAEWLLWISPDDSRALFDTALEVAAELDSEIMDQIRAVAALAERGQSATKAPEMELARAFSDVLEDAGIRLENVEGFPWDAGMRTLVLLDLNTALSCSARWQDTDVASLHQTLNPLIDQGVKRRQLSAGQSASLMLFETADKYISDVWGVIDEPPYGSREKRKGRFNDRSWRRSSHSHGSLPTLERYQSYLEWHAMWCAGGEILTSHRLAQHDWDYGSLDYEIRIDKLTVPPIWLSDLVGGRPLLESFWRPPQRPIAEWRKDATDPEILAEIMVADRPGYLVVDQSATTASRTFRHEVRVSTGLVSSDTAPALVRALQTTWDDFDYRIPPEGDDLEIDAGDYVLRGWLKSNDGDSRFDRPDRFCNGTRRIECEPGRAITKVLGLSRQTDRGARWFRSDHSEPTFIYEVWGHPEVEDDREIYYDDDVRSDGYRLLVRISDLAEFLHGQGMEMIMESGLRRDEKGKSSSSYDDKESTEVRFDRLFLFRLDGTIQAAERDVGAWRQDS